MKLGPFQILFLLILFLASCDTQQSSEEDSSLDGLGSAGVEVTAPFSSSSTTEQGGTVSSKVRLKSAPLSPVKINLKSSDTTEGLVSPSFLTFNKDNWDSYVSITATGQDDENADGPQSFEVQIESIVSDDPKYSALSGQVDPIKLQNEDDEIADFNVLSSGSTTSENGSVRVTYEVDLKSKPLETVTIPILSSNTDEGRITEISGSVGKTVDPTGISEVDFSTSNWNSVRTITVTGQNDSVRDGNIPYSVTLGPTRSSSNPYNNKPAKHFPITNTDNDSSGVSVSTTSLSTNETGSTDTFNVKLDTEPSADVTIRLRSSDPGEGVISVSSLTFTTTNYSDNQLVTVTGVDDTLQDGSQTFTIQLLPITGSGSGYDQNNSGSGYDPVDVTVVNADNEAGAGLAITVSNNSTSENGETGILMVSLNTEPSALVIIPVDDNDSSEAFVSPSTLIFTPTNWNSLQTITVTGLDKDDFLDGDKIYNVKVGPTITSDSNYSSITENKSFINHDNDTAGFYVDKSDKSDFELDERSNYGRFSLRLKSRPLPGDNVSLNVISFDDNSSISLLTSGNSSLGGIDNLTGYKKVLNLVFDNNLHSNDN